VRKHRGFLFSARRPLARRRDKNKKTRQTPQADVGLILCYAPHLRITSEASNPRIAFSGVRLYFVNLPTEELEGSEQSTLRYKSKAIVRKHQVFLTLILNFVSLSHGFRGFILQTVTGTS
jgi:hypothetical protein